MSRDFVITSVSEQIEIKRKSTSSVSFTVTNSTGNRLAVKARVSVIGDEDLAWIKIEGSEEREFAENDTQQYSVAATVPSDASAGSYKFRLDVFSVENPDEIYSEGPVVEVVISDAKEPEKIKKPFPWWIAAVIAVIFCTGAAIIWYASQEPEPKPKPKPKPVPVGIKVPYIIGKKYEAAFRILNSKKIMYQVFTDQKIKKQIDRMTIAHPSRPSPPSNLPARTLRRAPFREVQNQIPVVIKTIPKAYKRILPDKVLKVYFGTKTTTSYMKLEKSYMEKRIGINKNLILNVK